MGKFVAKHAALRTVTLSCLHRLLFKCRLSLGYPQAMEDFLNHHGVLFKQLNPFVLRQAERLRTHSHALAEKAGRPWQYFESPVRKDQRAREIASRDGITDGLVCVFATVEPCRSFRLAYGHGRPVVRPAWRKCLFLYFYFLDLRRRPAERRSRARRRPGDDRHCVCFGQPNAAATPTTARETPRRARRSGQTNRRYLS